MIFGYVTLLVVWTDPFAEPKDIVCSGGFVKQEKTGVEIFNLATESQEEVVNTIKGQTFQVLSDNGFLCHRFLEVRNEALKLKLHIFTGDAEEGII